MYVRGPQVSAPLLLPEYPWDGGGVAVGGAGTVLLDPIDGLYKVGALTRAPLAAGAVAATRLHDVTCARVPFSAGLVSVLSTRLGYCLLPSRARLWENAVLR